MNRKLHKLLAILTILLGIVHFVFGVVVFKQFNLEVLWFQSAGVAMIVTALANLRMKNDWILRVQNTLMLVFVIALLFLAPEPQAWLSLVLFGGLFALSWGKTTNTA